MIRCPECETEFDENEKKCPNCGFEVTFTCESCGKEVPASATKCPNCGAMFTDETVEEVVEVPIVPTTPQARYNKTINRLEIIKVCYFVLTILSSSICIILSIAQSNFGLFITAIVSLGVTLITVVFIDWAANVLECLSTLVNQKK